MVFHIMGKKNGTTVGQNYSLFLKNRSTNRFVFLCHYCSWYLVSATGMNYHFHQRDWLPFLKETWRFVHAQSCLTLCNPLDYSPPGVSVHRLCQARLLEWVAISSSRGSFPPRYRIHISCIGRWILYHWATWEGQRNPGDI